MPNCIFTLLSKLISYLVTCFSINLLRFAYSTVVVRNYQTYNVFRIIPNNSSALLCFSGFPLCAGGFSIFFGVKYLAPKIPGAPLVPTSLPSATPTLLSLALQSLTSEEMCSTIALSFEKTHPPPFWLYIFLFLQYKDLFCKGMC